MPGIIHLAVDHRIDQKCIKLLNIPLLNTEYDAVYVPRKAMARQLKPIGIENIEISKIL